MPPTLTYALILSVLLLGCTQSSTVPAPENGSLGFTMSGAVEGDFTASGTPPSGAAALPDARGENLMLFGGRTRGSVQDALNLEIPFPSQPGIYPAGMTSSLSWGMSTSFSGDGDFFAITAGEVTVTQIGGGRIRGSFSAKAERFSLDSDPESHEIEITDGTFDLPISPTRNF